MRPTRAIIDLSKISKNLNTLRRHIATDVKFMAVLKANAYGHGAVEVAKEVLKSGAFCLGVAFPDEGAELREAGVKSPILVLGGITTSQVNTVVEYDLSQCVFSSEIAACLNNEAAKYNKVINIHLKLDTGMNRIGVKHGLDLVKLATEITAMRNLKIEGVFTHFATADEADDLYLVEQLDCFNHMLSILNSLSIEPKYVHAANSAAILKHPKTHFNMVRAGISLYGYSPLPCGDASHSELETALQLETSVLCVKNIKAGESVSYSRTFIAENNMKIATLPIGYADGYNRLLSNNGSILIAGKRAPIVGRVCMDQLMVDVTKIDNVVANDKAVLIGKMENENIDANEIADLCGTISYEILTSISSRVTRVYLKDE